VGSSGQGPNWQTMTELTVLAAASAKNKIMTAVAPTAQLL